MKRHGKKYLVWLQAPIDLSFYRGGNAKVVLKLVFTLLYFSWNCYTLYFTCLGILGTVIHFTLLVLEPVYTLPYLFWNWYTLYIGCLGLGAGIPYTLYISCLGDIQYALYILL